MGSELLENEGAVSATQPSMVDGGRIDVFGSEGGNTFKSRKKDFYSQLLELKDYDTTDNYRQFCGGAQDLANQLQDIVDESKSSDVWGKYGNEDDFFEYERIIGALNKHFTENEQVCVKQTSNGWHIIYKV